MVQFEDFLRRVQVDYPELKFRPGHKFSFRPPRTVYFEQVLSDPIKNEQDLVQLATDSRSPSTKITDKTDLSIKAVSEISDQVEELSTKIMAKITDKAERSDKGMFKTADQIELSSKTATSARLEHNNYCLQLLHELGHALLQHYTFATDPERLKMECAAWAKARELCEMYSIYYDEEFVEVELDTYREWLHQKSRCPRCGLTRYQDQNGVYHCPECELLN